MKEQTNYNLGEQSKT